VTDTSIIDTLQPGVYHDPATSAWIAGYIDGDTFHVLSRHTARTGAVSAVKTWSRRTHWAPRVERVKTLCEMPVSVRFWYTGGVLLPAPREVARG